VRFDLSVKGISYSLGIHFDNAFYILGLTTLESGFLSMIWESAPWREELRRCATGLTRLAAQRRETDKRSALFERTFFFGAYAMRKLNEAKKLSSAWASRSVPGLRYPLIASPPDLMNWHRINERYDLSAGEEECLSAKDLSDMVIHSFVFMVELNDDRSISGVFLASDRSKRRGLWLFKITDLVEIMVATAEDNFNYSRWIRDPETGQWDVSNGFVSEEERPVPRPGNPLTR
jgi:hypothetical protein